MKLKITILISVWIVSLQALYGATNTPAPETKFKMDGSFDDWKGHKTAWSGLTKRPYILTKGDAPSPDEFVEITECFYTNDDLYFYVFFKFKPSLEERFQRRPRSGRVGTLHLAKAGATTTNLSAIISQAETRIHIPSGVYASTIDGKESSGAFVTYQVNRRDGETWQSSTKIREESSQSKKPMIAPGPDGVEMAVLLKDLGKVKGDTFNLVCVDDGFPEGNRHLVPIKLE